MSVLMDANAVPTPDDIYKSFAQSEVVKRDRLRDQPGRLQPIVNYILCEMRKDENVVSAISPSNVTIEFSSHSYPYLCIECAKPDSIEYLNQVLSPWTVSYCNRTKIVQLSTVA
jgi:hypothetical protein